MITLPHAKTERKARRVKAVSVAPKKKGKRSALEISDVIGIHGAFDRTLSDLHKQGR